MKILRSYILKEMFVPFMLAFGVLSFVFMLGNLVKLADLVINKGVHAGTVGMIFLLYIPVLMGYILPVACLIGVILAFGRLSADNEILAIAVGGIATRRLLAPLLMIGVILSLALFILNDRVIPYTYYEQKKMLKNLGTDNPAALLEAGVFIHAFESLILFIHRIDGSKLYNVTIYQPQPDAPTRTIIAKRGEFTAAPDKDQVMIKLMEGTADEPDPQNPQNYSKLNFKNYFLTLNPSRQGQTEKKPKAMTLRELTNKIREFRYLQIDTTRLQTEYLRKITWSLTPLIFIFIGFPIAVITHRRNKGVNILLATVCAAGYYLIFVGCEALSIENVLAPQIAMWIPDALGLLTGLILNARCAS